ncbi:MAG: phosphoribosyltransferase [Verrucomicrobia bacterium]|nr:phosphoribosyltransferase [Verrucomicrobiota bacterium]MBV8273948.1 phosphoribosyltransferase [Verrucomicrobiota bacterium]
MAKFKDRGEAGRLLATRLTQYANDPDLLVVALPRGGVPVGFEVAKALGAPLDILVVRKLGVPGDDQVAMGAIANGDIRVLDEDFIALLGITDEVIETVCAREKQELKRRELGCRGDAPPLRATGLKCILVDDGIATGSTMRAAIAALRQQSPAKVIVAVPTAPPSVCNELRRLADEVVVVMTPFLFFSVSHWYTIFGQTSDEQVRQLYQESKRLKEFRSSGLPGVALGFVS